MAQKTATIFLLDVASLFLEDDWKAVCHFVLHDMLLAGRKGDHAAVVLTNTVAFENALHRANGQYEHITVLQPMTSQPSFAFLQSILLLNENDPKALAPADLIDPMDGIVVATDLMMQHCRHLKYEKQIIYVTAMQAPAHDMDSSDHHQIANSLDQANIQLHILHCGAVAADPAVQQSLQAFKAKLDDAGLSSVSSWLAEAQQPQRRAVKPVATFKGPLYLSPHLSFEAHLIYKTMESKPVAPTRALRLADGTLADLKRAVSYHAIPPPPPPPTSSDNSSPITTTPATTASAWTTATGSTKPKLAPVLGKAIAEEDVIKAYRFGTSHVPVSAVEEAYMKISTEKGIWVREYLWQADVRHHHLLGSTSCLVVDPHQDAKAYGLFVDWVRTLITYRDQSNEELENTSTRRSKGLAVIARYVRTVNAAPQMVLLSPVLNAHGAFFYVCALPFADDMRLINVPSLGIGDARLAKKLSDAPFLPAAERAFWQRVQKWQPSDALSAAMDHFIETTRLETQDDEREDDEKCYPAWYDVAAPAPQVLKKWLMSKCYPSVSKEPHSVKTASSGRAPAALDGIAARSIPAPPLKRSRTDALHAMKRLAPITKVVKATAVKLEREAEAPRSIEDLLFLRDDSGMTVDEPRPEDDKSAVVVRDEKAAPTKSEPLPLPTSIIVPDRPVDSFVDALNEAQENHPKIFEAMAMYLKALKTHDDGELQALYEMAFASFKRACIDYDEVDLFDDLCRATTDDLPNKP